MISAAVHAAALAAMGFWLPPLPRGVSRQEAFQGHIVLKTSGEDRVALDSPDIELPSAPVADAFHREEPDAAAVGAAVETPLLAPLAIRTTQPLREDLLAETGSRAVQEAASGQGGGPHPGRKAGQARGELRRALEAGKARVRLFGLQGEGHRFVYVFDRSISMTGQRLETAKAELISSLKSLESTHQFHIVFFSGVIRAFELSAGRRAMPFATGRNLELAAHFVRGIEADGGTDRLTALELAVGMRPDVIFLLTDVDGAMSAAEVEAIRRRNDGRAVLNVVEFGYGPASVDDNFLKQLARQNSGQYLYLDSSEFGS